jgi:predicted dehydrogenase
MTVPASLRAALIGCGDISRSHMRSYGELGVQTVALCDVNRANAEALREKHDLPEAEIYTDHRELLKRDDLDFVSVATPVALHVPITLDALAAGLHVACEKPSALSIDENRQVIRAAEEAGKKVIFFSARMRGGYAKLARQYIQDGDLGEIYRVDVQYYRRRGRPGLDCVTHAHWFLDSQYAGGGVIMDMGQYFMDMVLHMTGWPEIDSALAYTFTGHDHDLPPERVFDVEEHCTFLARANGGKMGITFDLAWVAHHPTTSRVTILGTKGGICIHPQAEKPFIFHHNKGGPWHWMDTTTDWKDKSAGNCYPEFLQAIRGEDPGAGTTPQEALAITELTQMALRSAREGREIKCEELS